MRNYSSTAVATTLASAITSSDTSMTLAAATGLPSVPFTLVIEPDTAYEEIVTVTARSGTSISAMSRGQESTTARSHASASVVKHMVTGRDLQDAQDHIANTTTAHGVTGAVVGTTNSQTLTNKSISGSANTLTNIAQASVTSLTTDLSLKAPAASPTFTGTVVLPSTTSIGTVSSTEIGYVDGVTSAIQTQIDGKATLASPTFTGTPAAPTATAGTSTTQIATTAFVTTADNLKAPLANPAFTGNVYFYQPAPPTTKSSATTLTIAELLTNIIDCGGTTYTLTLPTGTNIDAGVVAGLAVDSAFNWSLINRGGGTVTVAGNTNHTFSNTGSSTVSAGTSAQFTTRKTATNTYVTYRIA